LQAVLGKQTGNVDDASESWEVCDLPGNQSQLDQGSAAGTLLRTLMETRRQELLGQHADREQFPLLIKFIDARLQLSLQVHPSQPTIQPDGSIQSGKSESWIVLDCTPESRMYLGLRDGVDETQLRAAIATGHFENCLHSYSPRPGDCIYLPAGTVHALGGGLLIAEIQQPSDITYRLHDWNRVDAQGQPRPLHLEQGLASTRFDFGPVQPVVPRPLPEREHSEELVRCEHFVIHRHSGPEDWSPANDNCMHALVVIQGKIQCSGISLRKGQTVILPASREATLCRLSPDAVLLDVFLP
jgi:mannose-6-phosphate isomerase